MAMTFYLKQSAPTQTRASLLFSRGSFITRKDLARLPRNCRNTTRVTSCSRVLSAAIVPLRRTPARDSGAKAKRVAETLSSSLCHYEEHVATIVIPQGSSRPYPEQGTLPLWFLQPNRYTGFVLNCFVRHLFTSFHLPNSVPPHSRVSDVLKSRRY